jgi:hypothetical protein
MPDDGSQTKRALENILLHRQRTDDSLVQLAEEKRILALISLGAPLPEILNELCTAIDVQIGNVVSLVWLPDEMDSDLYTSAQSAMQMGLSIFSSISILSREEALLGTLEIYGCDPRRPTPHEFQLIARAVNLAAIALQRHKDTDDFERLSRHLRSSVDGSASEKPQFIN